MAKIKVEVEVDERDVDFVREVLDEGRDKADYRWRVQTLNANDRRSPPETQKIHAKTACVTKRRIDLLGDLIEKLAAKARK